MSENPFFRYVFVCNRSGARIYKYLSNKSLSLIETLNFPEGQLKNQEINASSFGSQQSRAGHGANTLSTESDPTETITQNTARTLVERLVKMFNENHGARYIVVSEARLLGLLRKEIPDHILPSIMKFVSKDYAMFDEERILSSIEPVENVSLS